MSKRIRSFKLLQRLADMDLDRLRLKVSELQGRRDMLANEIDRLKENERLETAIAAQHPVESFTLPAFEAHTRLTLDQLHQEIKELDQHISDCLEEVHLYFQDSKKMELVKDIEIMRELQQQKKQEQSFYDQVAQTQFNRRKP